MGLEVIGDEADGGSGRGWLARGLGFYTRVVKRHKEGADHIELRSVFRNKSVLLGKAGEVPVALQGLDQ